MDPVKQSHYPFSAIVGQDGMKMSLVLATVDPGIGGVLVRGQKGTGKSTAVRALGRLLPEGRLVELPLNATEDRVVGALQIEEALKSGKRRFEPGLLARAHEGILYVDEVNLLDDHLVDILLDVAASGVNTVEREGLSESHPARFVLVGTMNPEEGELRPQFLDRFGLCAVASTLQDRSQRCDIVRRELDFRRDPAVFAEGFDEEDATLVARILAARKALGLVAVSDETVDFAVRLALEVQAQGHRADIVLLKAAKALAAFVEAQAVTEAHIAEVAPLVLCHRMARSPVESVDGQGRNVLAALSRVRGEAAPSDGPDPDEDLVEAEDMRETMHVPGSSAVGAMFREYLKKKRLKP